MHGQTPGADAAEELASLRMNGWDSVRAWSFIRSSRGYRTAWRRRSPPPGLPELAPFPVRLQTAVDMVAMEWGLLAWEDPYSDQGPISPFWAGTTTPDGVVTSEAPPLAVLAAEGNAALSGLRLGDGTLIVRIERSGEAAQVRIPGGKAFPEEGGLLLVREVARIEDVWSAVPAPLPGRVRGTGMASFCWRWRPRPKAERIVRSPSRSGVRNGSMRNTTPTAGCTRGSSAA